MMRSQKVMGEISYHSYDLFVSVLNRTVRIMSKPEYVRDIVKDRLLTTSRNRFALWKALPEKYFSALSREMKVRGWSLLLQGYPDLASFSLLEESDPEGNSWFAKVLDRDRVPRWLLWYGFSSQRMLDISREGIRYPAIFTSIRDDNPASIHPYRPFQPGALSGRDRSSPYGEKAGALSFWLRR